MRIRVVDYQGNLGGGVRFTIELLKALMKSHKDIQIELISYGPALERYRHLCELEGLQIRLFDVEPIGYWKNEHSHIFSVPWFARIARLLGLGSKWHFQVPRSVFNDCDVVWFPWVHRHRIPVDCGDRVVGTFHDAVFFQFPGIISKSCLKDEQHTIGNWLASSAEIIVTSHSTASIISELFQDLKPLHVIPASGEHFKEPLPQAEISPDWSWAESPFLIYPANTFPHKNHELLLEGYALWGAKIPLVLTGEGTDLLSESRGLPLRRLANSLGLEVGETLIPLGYISNSLYYTLLKHAWALVMPSLAEGGGSFPVYEAMLAGVPVICSDIPVMREQMERTGGNVLWFDPHSSLDLVEKLRELEENYERLAIRATDQVKSLHRRSWQDVGDEYFDVFKSSVLNHN